MKTYTHSRLPEVLYSVAPIILFHFFITLFFRTMVKPVTTLATVEVTIQEKT